MNKLSTNTFNEAVKRQRFYWTETQTSHENLNQKCKCSYLSRGSVLQSILSKHSFPPVVDHKHTGSLLMLHKPSSWFNNSTTVIELGAYYYYFYSITMFTVFFLLILNLKLFTPTSHRFNNEATALTVSLKAGVSTHGAGHSYMKGGTVRLCSDTRKQHDC